jgi:hypothetical protein
VGVQHLQRAHQMHRITASASATAAESASATYTPRKVALFVEPSPFSHISGMKNRFESLIKTLREAGDEVMVITPDPTPPKEFCGAQVCMQLLFPPSCTSNLSLTLILQVQQLITSADVGSCGTTACPLVTTQCKHKWHCRHVMNLLGAARGSGTLQRVYHKAAKVFTPVHDPIVSCKWGAGDTLDLVFNSPGPS